MWRTVLYTAAVSAVPVAGPLFAQGPPEQVKTAGRRPQPRTTMTPAPRSLIRALVTWALCLAGLLALASAARAQSEDTFPGRVGRIAEVQGKAWIYDDEQSRWTEAWRNRTLTAGDRLSTERGGHLQAGIGSTELRLDGNTEIEFERLDDERIAVRVHSGSLAVRVRSRDVARDFELLAGPVRGWTDRVGHYRLDREDGVSTWTAWRGALQLDTRDQRVTVDAGRSAQLFREGRDATVVTWGQVERDAFSDWVARDEDRDDRRADSSRYVSPEMTGADELDRYGRWERHPELGMVWYPLQVAPDWAPYRQGRWNWQARWGWTWVDDAPWGFAATHYGRWLSWGGRWVWAPGAYVARPVYAPALVAWVGGGGHGVDVTVSIGGGTVGWLPLSPWDVYVPSFRYPPRYFDRVNQPHRRPGVPAQVPTGPISYGNNGVPNAVTVVPAQVMQQRQPVGGAVLRETDLRPRSREHFQVQAPVPAPVAAPRVMPVPGGGQPAVAVPPAPGRDGSRQPSAEGERRRITVPGVHVPPVVAAPGQAAPRALPPATGLPPAAGLPAATGLPPAAALPPAVGLPPGMRAPGTAEPHGRGGYPAQAPAASRERPAVAPVRVPEAPRVTEAPRGADRRDGPRDQPRDNPRERQERQ